MTRTSFYQLMFVAMLFALGVAACAPSPTPVPTVAPTQPPTAAPTVPPTATPAPKPTEAPKPTVPPTTAPTATSTTAPTVAPTTVPATKPPAASNPVQALAARKLSTEIFTDSFEKGTVGEFAEGWNILDKDNHVAQKSGVRVAEPPVKSPDGKLAVKLLSNPAVDAKMNRDFAALPQGRLFFNGMVPSTDPGFLGVELRDGSKRLFSIEMHPEGRFRYRDDLGNLQECKVNYSLDKWYQVILEWDSTINIWQAYYIDDAGKQVRLTPENGVQFSKEAPGASPTRTELRLNKATPGKVGYLDNFKLFKIE